jgi:hypothetical protein
MEKSRKNLKIAAIVILGFAAFTLVSLAFELIWGDINSAVIPADAPENILQITKIFLASFTVLLLIPSFYVGIKGLCVAKKPNKSKSHIVWAIVVLVFTVVGLISPVVEIFNHVEVKENISMLLSVSVDILVYCEFIKYASDVRKAA